MQPDQHFLHRSSPEMQKVMDYATAATEWKINFPQRKRFSYIHYHISRYMAQTEMFYFQIFDFARGKAAATGD